jgi:hypothetical protein
MIENALDMGVSVKFVTGHECYGRDPALRQALQQRGIGCGLAVARNHHGQITSGPKERVDVTQRWLSAVARKEGVGMTGLGSPSTTKAQAYTAC